MKAAFGVRLAATFLAGALAAGASAFVAGALAGAFFAVAMIFFLRKVGVFTSGKTISPPAARMLLEKKRVSKQDTDFFRRDVAMLRLGGGLVALSARIQAKGRNMRHVFVYGTLRRGEVNDINQLSPRPQFVGEASVQGSLYPLGWYPGLVLGGPTRVVGEIYEVSEELEARLDEIEGLLPEPSGEYIKQQLSLEVDGRTIECFLYEIAPALVSHLVPMAEGDWLRRPSA